MIGFRIASALVLGGAIVAMGEAVTSSVRAEPRAVLELFTSQGCSSCPAADRLAGELARDPSLVVMTLSVDYWDYLGWKDTLAVPGHAGRQRAYAKARGDREVYTPQIVVNGIAHAIGSDKAAIERTIAETRRAAAPLKLSVAAKVVGENLVVEVPGAQGMRGEVWLCPISGSVPVKIARGENKGRTVTYSNVVRRWVKLGEFTGKAETYSIPVSMIGSGDIDRFAVVVQGGQAGEPKLMLGAAQSALR